MKTASGILGVESVAMDKDQKLTVTGDIDPIAAVRKLRKLCHTEIVSVGPAKEPEKKKEEPKKDQPKDVIVTYPYVYQPKTSRKML
ncbi:Detected protein of confused Function [Hibiscus syriacus]|uniref:Detected protein of confused Function n=1 Tax=Hibiscus syriacus TaxID=106335 RepID=A0A6A3D4M9_HIBSY|nr:Detected protein of confused Function [Hibiscus syriacus]